MKKINYLLASGIMLSFAMSAAAGTAVPVQYQLRDSTADPVDIKVEAKVEDLDGDGMPDVQATVGGRVELEKFNSAGGATDAASRVLPTVNKKTVDGSADRLLPTVNKKTSVTVSNEGRDRLKVTVRGWDAEKKEEVANMEKNVKATTDADENIDSITIAPDKIEMTYRRPAKLFGFLPVAYQHAFTVDEKGNVAQGHPWWLMFAKDDADNFGSDVKYIFQNNQSDLVFVKMQTVMQQQMQRFSALSNIMKTRHDVAMNAIRNMK